MALNYDQLTAITRAAIAPLYLDNLFSSTQVFSRLSVKQEPGRGLREMFDKIDELDNEVTESMERGG